MCRFAAYIGPEIFISSLVTKPKHSLIHQSYNARERIEPLNGDGFGVGWYAPHFSDSPALFKDVNPAWSNGNLVDVARVTKSSCIFAHVRAATVGAQQSRVNCHPFSSQNYMFMHNGTLFGFDGFRRKLRQRLSDEAYAFIQGNTDSEHIFALVLDRLRQIPDPSAEDLATALVETIAEIEQLKKDAGVSVASTMNLVLTDGNNLVASRYISKGEESNSLYYAEVGRYSCTEGKCHLAEGNEALLLVSEPLNDSERWQRIENNQLILVNNRRKVKIREI